MTELSLYYDIIYRYYDIVIKLLRYKILLILLINHVVTL